MIREATLDDIPGLMVLGRSFHARSLWAQMPLDEGRVEQHIISIITGENTACYVLDDLTGAVGVYIAPLYFTDAFVAQEAFWYCESRRGLSLMRKAEEWARERGAACMFMSRIEGLADERVDQIYRRDGYRPTEHTYMKVLA